MATEISPTEMLQLEREHHRRDNGVPLPPQRKDDHVVDIRRVPPPSPANQVDVVQKVEPIRPASFPSPKETYIH